MTNREVYRNNTNSNHPMKRGVVVGVFADHICKCRTQTSWYQFWRGVEEYGRVADYLSKLCLLFYLNRNGLSGEVCQKIPTRLSLY